MSAMSGSALMLNGLNKSVGSIDSSITSLPGNNSTPPNSTSTIQRTVSRASRALVVQQQVAQALVGSEVAFSLATGGSSHVERNALPAASLTLGTALATRLALLRLTCYATAFSARDTLKLSLRSDSPPRPHVPSSISSDSVREASQGAANLLNKAEYALLAHLWNDTLVLFAPTHAIDPDAIIPTPATRRAPSSVPPKAIVGCVLAALNIGDNSPIPTDFQSATAATTGAMGAYRAARHMCESYLAAASEQGVEDTSLDDVGNSTLGLLSDVPPDTEGYARIVELYAVEVLGKRMNEWEYAWEVVRYSRLPSEESTPTGTQSPSDGTVPGVEAGNLSLATKKTLQAVLAAAQEQGPVSGREKRIKDAAARLRTAVADEQSRRTEVENAAAAATAATARAAVAAASAASATSSYSPVTATASSGRAQRSSPTRSTGERSGGGGTAPEPTRSRSNSGNGRPRSPPGSFAQSRDSISKTIERHHQRDRERTTSPPSSDVPVPSKTKPVPAKAGTGPVGSRATNGVNALAQVRTVLSRVLARWGTLVPFVVPLVGLVMALIWRFRQRQRPGPKPIASAGTGTGGSAGSALGNAVAAVWDTLKMGTQVTYL